MRDALRGALRRVRAIVLRRTLDRELDDELRLHVELETEQLLRQGAAPATARREALHRFGGLERYSESTRDARGSVWLDALLQDVRLSMRMLRRNPGFAAAAVLTLGLGIGASTAIFTLVDTVLLRATPFPDPDRLVVVWETDEASGTRHEPASWPDIEDLRERSRTLSAIAALVAVPSTLTGAGDPERVSVLGVTPNMFDVLGIRPLFGRTFEAGEGPITGPYRALLAEDYWRRRFAGDVGIVGRTVDVDGRSAEIIGVLPRGTDLGIAQLHARADYGAPLAGTSVDMWIAVEPTAAAFPRETHPFFVLARLADDATHATVQAELTTIMADLEATYPENAARGAHLQSYRTVTFGPVRPALLVLLGAVCLVLLVACVNVANLLLARTAVRTREFATRTALGADTARVRRQLLTESIVLGAAGAATGIACAYIGVRLLVALAPADIPRLDSAAIDLRILAFTTCIAAAAVLGFGMAPASRAGRFDLLAVLKAQPGRAATQSREHRRFRRTLVIAQIALAFTLVTTASLLLRSFVSLTRVDAGFATAGVLKVQFALPDTRYARDAIPAFHARLLERARTLPGVTAAALAAMHPLDAGFTNSFVIVGREAESRDFPEIRTRFVTPGYLATLDVPLRAGRDLTDGDVASAPAVALLNEAAVSRYFDGADPIGREIRFWGTPRRIVGIIGNERFRGLDEPPEPAVYSPLAQLPLSSASLLLRSTLDPNALASDVRRLMRELDPELALHGIETLDVTVARSIARPRFTAVLIGIFAAAALILALIGVYGVLSYDVAQRTAELGIRTALGASRAHVYRLVLADGLVQAAIGTAAGVAAALLAGRAIEPLLFLTTPHDAATFATVATAILLMATLASWVPAHRAARAQPMDALRSD